MKPIQVTEHFGSTIVTYAITLSPGAVEVMQAYDKYKKLRRLGEESQWFNHPANQELDEAGLAQFDKVGEGQYLSYSLSERGKKVLAKMKQQA